MAEASLLHIANSVLGMLTSYAIDEVESMWGAKEDLQRLVSTIEIIKAGLLDAERLQESRDQVGEHARVWLRRLRYVLYDADDLFDKVFTIEESKSALTGKEKLGCTLSQFFSRSNPVYLRVEIARKVKKIRSELDDIESDMGRFKLDSNLLEKTISYDREAGSVVWADEIIGREEDEEILKGLLMDATSKKEGFADVIALVGFGGLGKTSLALLLYNNRVVKESFELRPWACISDAKGKTAKARIILDSLQTFESTGSSNPISVDMVSVDKVEREIHERVKNKKYLLVVDDYWDEDRNTWLYLMGLLRGGKTGSKILVTTRSSNVTRAMGIDSPYRIKGLADDKAWELFKRLAFRSEADVEDQSLIEMGKEIVQKCKNVPLAIKAIASLLYTCDNQREWKSIKDSDMLTLERTHQNLKILPILKLSYDHLPSHLKHCFAFCSVFPKDYEMKGEMLVHYWIAQGYVAHCSDRGRAGLVEIGEKYLRELTARSFLQHSSFSGYYIMHDLMHDLAQTMAGEEVYAVDRGNGEIMKSKDISKDTRIRHLSFRGVQIDDDLFFFDKGKYVRSCICFGSLGGNNLFTKAAIWKKLSCLRLLDMSNMTLELLPCSVGELKHLRCLYIPNNKFEHLPDEITKLHNLRILDVSGCSELESLPNNLNRLINLTSLALKGCDRLTSVPCKFGELTSLESLDRFIVGMKSTKCSGLEAIARLVNLRGKLKVAYRNKSGGGLRKEKTVDLSPIRLDELTFQWSYDGDGIDFLCRQLSFYVKRPTWYCDGESECEGEGIEFECSQLPSNLKKLYVRDFRGQKLPEWEKSFNNLLEVHLNECGKCICLPSFGRHPQIRVLELLYLDNLEYIEVEDEFVAETHFPFLWKLELRELPKLKAWSRGMEKLGQQFQLQHMSSYPAASVVPDFPRFHSLTSLSILDCLELTSMPLPFNGTASIDAYWSELKEPLRTLLIAEEGVQRKLRSWACS